MTRHRQTVTLAGALLALAVSLLGAGANAEEGGRWVAGDFHIHTTYSHDSWDPVADDNTGPDEPWVLGHSVSNQFAIAAARGLDFLAITDHNDIRSQADPGFGSQGVLGIPAYENSLGGHAQMLGARACYHPEGPVAGQVTNCNNFGDKSAARVTQMADALRADGGLLQINHPADGDAAHPMGDWPKAYGYDVIPDTAEVWNITPLWQQPMPSGNSTDDALSYWEGFLDRGYHVAATGGSDNHWVSTTAVQGAGQPTTWVWIEGALTVDSVLDGLRKGRTFVSAQPPAHNGPKLFLSADIDGDDEADAMVGDTVPAGSLFDVVAEGLPPVAYVQAVEGARDGTRRVTRCEGTTVGAYRCRASNADPSFQPTWIRAEAVAPDGRAERAAACDEQVGDETTYCRNRLAILALTSPIYIAP